MRKFDYSFLRTGNVPAKFIELTALIYSLREKGRYRFAQHPEVYKGLENISKFQSIKSSNALEGIRTSDDRIRSIISGSAEPLTHDEKEISGYRDALDDIHTRSTKLDFTEKDILEIHNTMYSQSNVAFGGKYKTTNNLIVEFDSYGRRNIRYIPCSAEETPEAMEQMTLAYIVARSEPGINRLLLIPCAILDFLCIHPFEDGNGRVSRLLSLLLLYKEGFDVGKYISFENEIEKRKDFYYEALRLSSIGWDANQNDYFAFAEDFLSTLYHCYKELDDRFAIVGDDKFSKTNRIEATVLNRLTPISKDELCQLLPDISVFTIQSVLGQMVRDGKVEKIGVSKGSRYIRK